ncbi:Acyl-(acyl-carrier-protein)--UDP-N- acetylglucosamine O-acyltransferase [Prochlorococcus marinus str. MIT 9321]|uniref:Acyl-(Acyl-carrier-protein)--UDP-N-acetylglucosamine O-acyltransferase n=1 Tax=Prochlorococcus marinus str. MIT 9401 TaxID=167551 RepID=A0A0A2B8P6_PROMR|nr:acyl-ACP--UDP-N-acetylglucosamine O-acyltransferase [Prochlorococcus marinus]KGG02743.1 Acyl-(acyl-carrier-protein)--UDP-N- acetylglucosamine O-acyltransferase [Prochlorococcus marinus str. MIT 9321]KGG05377.1 Acyl-(acyl-carrier-protein)--UDP-N- acetylglucosamine O-acyltransferase [Prochlorococcus marinus str. MIT 9322]KGG10438.1 Acyl-(acyl-carrier-protein)--UDP-N- acetylglucosamine O-acyltransferase [Prochlorococcus marinus str. MIT 9401]
MDSKSTEFKSNMKGVKVHPNAFVDPSAELHDGVIISPGAIVGPDVIIGNGTEIGPNAVITGKTQIGKNNKVFPNVFIGLDPQDLKYKGASTEVIIGDNNTFRECVTINKATNEGEKTVIGNNNLLMAYTHIGHNCELGNRIVLSNSVQVAGHVKVEDNAIIGGCLGIHQFVHIGYLAMIGGMTRVDRDVPPFCLAEGHPGRLRGLNRIGIKRSGLMENNNFDLKLLQTTWNLLFKSNDAITNSLDKAMNGELDLSSSKLCIFLKKSISKERRGPMPVMNL